MHNAKESSRKWYQKNQAKQLLKRKENYYKDIEKSRAELRQRRELLKQDPEKYEQAKLYNREYHAKNKDNPEYKEKRRLQYLADQEKRKARDKKPQKRYTHYIS